MEVLNKLARYNGKASQPLTVAALEQIERDTLGETLPAPPPDNFKTIAKRAVKQLSELKFGHIRALFGTKKNALSTGLICFLWALIGLASPLYSNFLPVYLANHGAQSGDGSVATTYRNNFIIVCCTIPGTTLGGLLINLRVGRKGILSLALIGTAIFQFAFTTARTQAAILGFNCAAAVVQYMMWAGLYCYTPEVLPSVHRGTGAGLAATFNRVFSLFAPVIATFAGLETNAPIFVSAALFVLAGLVTLILPYEPRGKASV